MLNLEIERKFLLRGFPPGFEQRTGVDVLQGYMENGLRYRKMGNHYYRTEKAGSGMVMQEHEEEITAEEFERVWPETEGRRLAKRRTEVPLGDDLTAEVDVFGGELEGLLYVEVEFRSEEVARSFKPPSWFGREVTDDPRYKNQSLARYGLPDDWRE